MMALAAVPVLIYLGLGYLIARALSRKGWCPEGLRLALLVLAPLLWAGVELFAFELPVTLMDPARRHEEAITLAILLLRIAAVLLVLVFAVENIRAKTILNRIFGILWIFFGVILAVLFMSSI